jgi:hypothetical protein
MTTDNECWRLARDCACWAAETQDRSVRTIFLAMAKAWSRLGLQEDFDSEFGKGQERPLPESSL